MNYAIANALPERRSKAEENPYARVLVRALKFATRAEWMTPEPVPLHSFEWKDIAMGQVPAMARPAAGIPVGNTPPTGPFHGRIGGDLMLIIGAVRDPMLPSSTLEPQALGSAGAGRGRGPIAEVTTNPNDATILGLRNLSMLPWRVAVPTGQALRVD